MGGTLDPLDQTLALLDARPPTLGAGRLLCVDGPAGSGKTTFAAAVAAARPGTPVVHTDDLLEGWPGLPGLAERLDPLLLPLADGRPGRYRRWDWYADGWTQGPQEWVAVQPAPLLVVEGVGSGARRHADLATVLVWVVAPNDQRLERGLARDGEAARPHWERWLVDERRHFWDEGTPDRADVVVWTGDPTQR